MYQSLKRTDVAAVRSATMEPPDDHLKNGARLKSLIGKCVCYLFVFILSIVISTEGLRAQQFTVTGTISEGDGKVMPGVSILVKGTNMGTVSSVDGKYSINVPYNEAILVFLFLGYETQEIPIAYRRKIDVRLYETDFKKVNDVARYLSKGKFRGGMDFGFAFHDFNFYSPCFNFYGGYNLQNNMNVGIKWGVVSLDNVFIKSDLLYMNMDIFSRKNYMKFVGSYTYYFGSRATSLMPFVGGGLGLYYNYDYGYYYNDYIDYDNNQYNHDYYVYRDNGDIRYNKFGGFINTGFEWNKFRLTVEYNLVPAYKVPLKKYQHSYNRLGIYEETAISSSEYFKIRNSYLAITAGFYLGYGNRKKELRELAEIAERERKETFSYFAPIYVEQEINNWMQKDKFEKTDAWLQRISTPNLIAKEAELRQNVEQAYIAERSKNMPAGNTTLGYYNVDKEAFLIENDLYGDWQIAVPKDEAPEFRNKWSRLAKTPNWVIRNDRIAFAGYKFDAVAEQKDSQTAKLDVATDTQPAIDYAAFTQLRKNDRAMGAFLRENDDDIYSTFSRGASLSKMGKTFLIAGLSTSGAGIVMITVGINQLTDGNAGRVGLVEIGYIAIGVGQGLTIASIPMSDVGGRLKKRAVDDYERKYFKSSVGYQPSLDFTITGNGAGVALRFYGFLLRRDTRRRRGEPQSFFSLCVSPRLLRVSLRNQNS